MILFGAFRNGLGIGRLHIFQIATVLGASWVWAVDRSHVAGLPEDVHGQYSRANGKTSDLSPATGGSRCWWQDFLLRIFCIFVPMVAPTFRTSS